MNTRARLIAALICAATLSCVEARSQTGDARRAGATPQEQPLADPVANEISQLRKSLQTLNARLREISDKLLAPDSKLGDAATDRQKRIALNLDLLTRTEQRAEALRKELLEATQRETAFKNRLMQLDEDLRPESIDRSLSLSGSVRSTTDLRDARRRLLENEHRGVENLLSQTTQTRQKLEEDVKQADALVARLRQRLLPLIEKEIDKINPDEKE